MNLIIRRTDRQSYLQRITPRKPKSAWSKRNREIAERLINESSMNEPGLAQVRAAKADGRWDNAYTASELNVPEDFLAALEDNPEAKRFFDTLNKSSRYVIAHGLSNAKKTVTRKKRFNKFLNMLLRGAKP
ncbi:MAG: YdeI/OmpD-associated family protein [Melioribacter sp.]|uniref:YdeI/OmpD-associated family protein n=1 Tax=Melioribacter sp. TaxID=2052167 RepID=UPI003BC01395